MHGLFTKVQNRLSKRSFLSYFLEKLCKRNKYLAACIGNITSLETN